MANISEEIREKKKGILEDMRSFITYTPCRESDILAFMEQYQKAEPESRPEILENLRSCMDGESYPNPYLGGYRYTEAEILECEEILDRYIERLETSTSNTAGMDAYPERVIDELNKLNARCNMCLIDTWRRDRLLDLIDAAATEAGLEATNSSQFKQSLS